MQKSDHKSDDMAVPEPVFQEQVAGDSWLGRIAAATLFITLALGLVVPKLAGGGFLLLSLLGLIWLESALRGRQMRLAAHEKLFFLSVLLFVAIWLMSWWLHGLHPVGADDVGRILRLLLIIPLYLFLRRIDGLENSWWAGLTVGAIGAGVYALWFSITGAPGEWEGRVGGPTNPIYFGGVVMAFGLMLLPRVADETLSTPLRAVVALAVLLALMASALSGSRGAWLALPPLLLLYILTLGAGQRPLWRFGVPVLFLLAAIVISFLPMMTLGDRFYDGWAALTALFSGEEPGGTLGIRWALWQVSMHSALEHLWLGGGPGAFRIYLEEAVATGQLDAFFLRYHHPHNQFLSALLIGGIPALLSLLMLMGFPLLVVARSCWNGFEPASAAARWAAWCGMTIVVVFFVMSLTESIFQRNNGIVWFVLLVSASMALSLPANRRCSKIDSG